MTHTTVLPDIHMVTVFTAEMRGGYTYEFHYTNNTTIKVYTIWNGRRSLEHTGTLPEASLTSAARFVQEYVAEAA